MFLRILLASSLAWASQAGAQCITVLVDGVNDPPQFASNLVQAQSIVNQHGCTSGGLNTIEVRTTGFTDIGTFNHRVIIGRPTHIKGGYLGERHRLRSISENSGVPVEINARAIIEDITISQFAGSHPPQGGIVVNAGGTNSELRGVRVGSSRQIAGIVVVGASGVLIAPSGGFPVEVFGSENAGISVRDAVNVTIRGAYVGLTAAGVTGASRRNLGWGIDIRDSVAVTVGGSQSNPDQRNVIANNGLGAVRVINSSLVNIYGNFIGVRADGVTTAPNGTLSGHAEQPRGGIRIVNSTGVDIGGATPGRRNLMLADRGGVTVAGSDFVNIQDNIMGMRLDGVSAAFGNPDNPPVLVLADSGHSGTIRVGGAVQQSNLIYGATGIPFGIRIEEGAGRVDMRRNHIWNFHTGAIDRGPPPAPPVLTFVDPSTGLTQGTVTPVPNDGEVDVFMHQGNQAEQYLGTASVAANSSSFSLTVSPGSLIVGRNLTAGFTRLGGAAAGTSGLSAPLAINHVMRNLSALKSGQGTVTSVPAGIDCGSSCAAQFVNGTQVTLTASAQSGWAFVGWGGAGGSCSGTSPNCTVNMTVDRVASASFAEILPDTHTLVVEIGGTGNGTVTSSPPGINCSTGTCQAEFDEGTQVTLNQSEGPDSAFEGWSGACSDTGGCTVTMSQNRLVGALFSDTTVQHTLEVIKIGNGFVFSVGSGGINCGEVCGGTYNEGSVINLNTNDGAFGWNFSHWEGGPCHGVTAMSCPVTMDQDHVITAVYVPDTERSLNVVRVGEGRVLSDPESIDCGGACDALFEQGTDIALEALPTPGWGFVQWSGGACDGLTETVCEFTLAANTEVTATFESVPVRYSLAVSLDGTGRVNSDPAGIMCPSGSCYALFDPGTPVQLSALTAVGWTFVGWTEGPCEGSTSATCAFTLDADTEVAAQWTPVIRTLGLTLDGTGGGSVVSEPEAMDCDQDCQEGFPHGTPVTLIATPAAGSVFGGWSGECAGGGDCTLTMTADRNATATFLLDSPDTHTLSVTVAGNGGVVSSPAGIICPSGVCQADFVEGQTVTLTATAAAGWEFSQWSGTDLCGGLNTPQCHVFMDQPYLMEALFIESSGGEDLIFQDRFQNMGGQP